MHGTRWFGGLVVAALIFGLTLDARALDYAPSREKLQEAVEYGMAHAKKSIDRTRRHWFKRVGTGAETIEFMLMSPYFLVAVEARGAAREYRTLTPGEARRVADESMNRFQFMAHFLARSASVARGYKGFVQIGKTVLQPKRVEDADCTPHDEGRLLCSIVFEFPVEQVPSDADVTLIVVPGMGREKRAKFKLARVP